MGSVGVVGEDESQPITNTSKKSNSSLKLHDECCLFNGASVPRKLRSVIKKQPREFITLPLPISKKQRHVACGVETLRKYSTKKSKLNTKRKNITKDEEEVAETLFALADMFSGATNDNKPRLDAELSETKTSTLLEAGTSIAEAEDSGILTLQTESRKISIGSTLEDARHSSNLVNSTGKFPKLGSCGDGQLANFPFVKIDGSPSTSTLHSDFSLGSRPKISIPEMTQNIERETPEGQIGIHGIQQEDRYKPNDQDYGLFLAPTVSSTGASSSSDNQGPGSRFPPWFGNTNNTTQPCEMGKSATTDYKKPQVVLESKKSWKISTAHVSICRLIKFLQQSDEKETLLGNSNQLTTNNGVLEVGPHLNINNQNRGGTNGSDRVLSFNGITHSSAEKNSAEVQNAIILHKRLLQEQREAANASVSCSSVKPGLSLCDAGDCDLNSSKKISSSRGQVPFLQSQSHLPVLSSLHLQNRYSSSSRDWTSAIAPQQVPLPPFLSSIVGSGATAPAVRHSETRQAEWRSNLTPHHNSGGVAAVNLPEWQIRGIDPSSSLVNCAQALFPHLHSALAPKYQQLTPTQQQQQFMVMNSSSVPLPSNVKRQNHHHHLPLQEKWFFAAQTGNL